MGGERDTAFVFNPTAQTGRAGERWDDIARCADRLGIRFERHDTVPGGGTATLVKALVAAKRWKTVACFGGDGTVSEAIQGFMRARDEGLAAREDLPALAVVPFGTGNDIAKSFGISSDETLFEDRLEKAIETIRFGADFRMDLGYVDGKWFADAFTVGVDSSILRQRNIDREQVKDIPFLRRVLRDYLLYFVAGLKRFFTHRRALAQVQLDDRIVECKVTNLVVKNTKVYAGEFIFVKDCRANDGLLDVVFFTGWRDYLTKYLVAARFYPVDAEKISRVLVRHSENYKSSRLKIRLSRAMDSQVDGEEHRSGDYFEVRCVPDALTLKTPVG